MSISSEISRISKNVSDSLEQVALKGVTVPSGSTSDDLPDLISQISSGLETWETVYNDTVAVTILEDDYYLQTITFGYTIDQNSVWKITWNGTPYECTATSVGDPVFPPYALGNDTIVHLQGGNNEPFFLQKIDASTLVVISATSQTVSLKIEKLVSGVIIISDTTDVAGGIIRTITASDTTTLVSKTVTSNGTYLPASDNADGYSEIIVDVSGGATWETVYSGTVPCTSDWGNGYYYNGDGIPFTETIDYESEWRVIWNNTAYTCTATEFVDTGGLPYCIGNCTYDGGQSGTTYPFFMQKYYGDILYVVSEAGTYALTLQKKVSSGGTTLITKTITANGTYSAEDDDADGYSDVTVAIPSGTVTAPSTISGTSATVSTGTNTLTLTKTVSVTPSVTTAGYVSSGTAGNSSVSLTASVTTKAAATITPTKSTQTIASGTYLTGTQTIAAIPAAYQDVTGVTAAAGDVVSGKSIVDSTGATVNGSLVIQHYYTGSGTPSSSTGVNGDIYLKTS